MTALYPTKLGSDEDYASVDDILNCSDLPEATVRIPGWKKGGKALVLRVRAPSLAQKELIYKESTRKDGSTDNVAEVEATLRECVIVPKFTLPQASQLRTKNGVVAEQIARFCMSLGSLDQEFIDGIVQQLTGAAAAPTTEEPAPPTGD
jgi:hypothetical protein